MAYHKLSAEVSQLVDKLFKCVFCKGTFVVEGTIKSSGSATRLPFGNLESGRAEAEKQALNGLDAAYKNFAPLFSCPYCGKFQPEMVSARRAAVGGSIIGIGTVLSFFFAGIPQHLLQEEYPGVLSGLGAYWVSVGGIVVVLVLVATLLSFWFNPNSGRFFPLYFGRPKQGTKAESEPDSPPL